MIYSLITYILYSINLLYQFDSALIDPENSEIPENNPNDHYEVNSCTTEEQNIEEDNSGKTKKKFKVRNFCRSCIR